MLAAAVEVEVHSTVGAGDAMVGGLLAGFLQDGKARTALRCGAAAGTASVMTEGTQLIVPADYERLLPQVQIQDM
jgi:fructose-1-phosphate kinase PfkB-like protein